MLDSIISVKSLKKLLDIKKEGAPIKLHIEAVVNGKIIYQETTNCYILMIAVTNSIKCQSVGICPTK